MVVCESPAFFVVYSLVEDNLSFYNPIYTLKSTVYYDVTSQVDMHKLLGSSVVLTGFFLVNIMHWEKICYK